MSFLKKKKTAFLKHFGQIVDTILVKVSVAKTIVEYLTPGKTINLTTNIFKRSKHHPTRVTRLKFASNMGDKRDIFYKFK